jgi:hypothetical protein
MATKLYDSAIRSRRAYTAGIEPSAAETIDVGGCFQQPIASGLRIAGDRVWC